MVKINSHPLIVDMFLQSLVDQSEQQKQEKKRETWYSIT
jgi:hypothetical protein